MPPFHWQRAFGVSCDVTSRFGPDCQSSKPKRATAIWIKRPLRTPLVTIRLELIASVSVTDPRDKAIKPRETPRRSEQPYTASKSAAGRAPRRSARAARVSACRARVILKAMMQLMDAKMRRTNAPM